MCRHPAACGATRSSRCAISDARAARHWSERLGGLLAGAWAGMLLCVALIATRVPFAVLQAPEAGRVATRVLAYEAHASLVLALLLYVIVRRQARASAAAGAGSIISGNVLLVLGTLFCTVAGYFAVQPMMDAARAGQGAFTFATLHLASVLFFALKIVLVILLGWRLAAC